MEFTNPQFWVTTILGLIAPFIVAFVKWIGELITEKEIKDRVAFIVTLVCSGGISVGSFYLAKYFTGVPTGLGGEFAQIFILSQVVYQLLKDNLKL